jgi:hypothetical protein
MVVSGLGLFVDSFSECAFVGDVYLSPEAHDELKLL